MKGEHFGDIKKIRKKSRSAAKKYKRGPFSLRPILHVLLQKK